MTIVPPAATGARVRAPVPFVLIVNGTLVSPAVTKTGLVVIPGQEKPQEKSTLGFDKHPYQGVVMAVGGELKESLKPGDYVLCKSPVEVGNFRNNTVLIAGNVFGFMYIQDIICSL